MADPARDDEQAVFRTRALVALGVAVVLALGAWVFVTRATEGGLNRLARIDRDRARCDTLWAATRTASDTVRVSTTPLPDTIDPRSSTALKRCGDLRVPEAKPLPNPREMSGEPMPRGLR